uniref:Uncharacterized LOC114921164 n=1 Tax=Labrus bergylta TaxID=56723 RepID=A0A3Q3F2F6_9LABR
MKATDTSSYEVPQLTHENQEESKNNTDEDKEPRRPTISSMQQTAASPAISEEKLNQCETYDDTMQPPKPPRKNCQMKASDTSSYEVEQLTHENQEESKPEVMDESQSEVKVKPVPRPRTKIQPKDQSNDTNNSADSVDTTSSTTNGESSPLSEKSAVYKRPGPARPRPPSIYLTSILSKTKAKEETIYINAKPVTTVEPPAEGTEKTQSSSRPRPARPPPPAIYYERLTSSLKLKSENNTDEDQEPRRRTISSMQQTAASPAVSEEKLNQCETYDDTVATERPAVPPRLGQSTLPYSASECDYATQQARPPPPSFTPPPPPSTESIYSEIDYRPYLDVLPDDNLSMRSTFGSAKNYPLGFYSSYHQSTEGTEDIRWMLRWFKGVSKSDSMDPPQYGLSIEEESRSFNQRAMNVRKALRLYNLLMMKRNETLRDIIADFNVICESLDKMHKQNKTMGIAGGTTGAVGGVTAVLGIALAPATLGASLIATAVGAGMVASAGGINAHKNKVNKKFLNKMAVEKLVYDYKENVVDLEHCLDFILSGMNELRRHDIARLQRAGAPPDAVKMAHLSQSVHRMDDGKKVSHTGGMSSERLLQEFAMEIDQYFKEKDDRKLKKSSRSKFSGRVCMLAKNLQSELDHLNRMWECSAE